MPPQAKEPAAGFRYTPSSYLQRTRLENRPWTSQGNDSNNDMEMKQEDRPSRKHSPLDVSFATSLASSSSFSPSTTTTAQQQAAERMQQAAERIQKRKDLYRGILKGDTAVEPMRSESSLSGSDDGTGYLEQLLLETTTAAAGSGSRHHGKSHSSSRSTTTHSSAAAEQARQARQRRLKTLVPSSEDSFTSGTTSRTFLSEPRDSEAARVRLLRAQRLRQLKRTSADEVQFGEVLRQRRLEQLEENRIAKEQERLEEDFYWKEQRRLEQERAALAEERRLLEAAQRRAAREEEERQHQQQEDEERRTKHNKSTASATAKLRKSHSKKDSHRRRKSDSAAAATAAVPQFNFLEEVQFLVRESGLLKTCVVSCFGNGNHDDDGGGGGGGHDGFCGMGMNLGCNAPSKQKSTTTSTHDDHNHTTSGGNRPSNTPDDEEDELALHEEVGIPPIVPQY